MRIEYNYDLSHMNTFGLKVSCACFVEYDQASELEELDFKSLPKPLFHIGAGSNLLFTSDFPGTILHSKILSIKYMDMGLDELMVMVGSGVKFDDFVANTCDHNLWGAENLSLIPAEVGGAVVQNIGAYGVELRDILSGVLCYDLKERKKCNFKASECKFGYRHSIFKEEAYKGRYIILSALFRLSRKPKPKTEYKDIEEALGGETVVSPRQMRDIVIGIRKKKLPEPSEMGNAGSFFRNPVVSAEKFAEISPDGIAPHYKLEDGRVKIPAAWLIESCGLKGASQGGASVYEKQPLVIINTKGEALSSDILSLENRIISEVKARFGVELQAEVEHM